MNWELKASARYPYWHTATKVRDTVLKFGITHICGKYYAKVQCGHYDTGRFVWTSDAKYEYVGFESEKRDGPHCHYASLEKAQNACREVSDRYQNAEQKA